MIHGGTQTHNRRITHKTNEFHTESLQRTREYFSYFFFCISWAICTVSLVALQVQRIIGWENITKIKYVGKNCRLFWTNGSQWMNFIYSFDDQFAFGQKNRQKMRQISTWNPILCVLRRKLKTFFFFFQKNSIVATNNATSPLASAFLNFLLLLVKPTKWFSSSIPCNAQKVE